MTTADDIRRAIVAHPKATTRGIAAMLQCNPGSVTKAVAKFKLKIAMGKRGRTVTGSTRDKIA